MTKGNTCFYEITAKCGAPQFKPTNTSGVSIEYIEIPKANTTTKATGKGVNSNDTAKRTGPPADGLPPRNSNFSSSSSKGDNPPPKNGGNGTNGTNGGMGGGPRGGPQGNKGDYNNQTGGAKAFGNTEQGSNPTGKKNSTGEPDCQDRQMMIAVTATDSSTSLLLELNSVEFSSARYLGLALVAFFGAISVLVF